MRMLLALMEAILRDTAVTIIEDIQWIDPSTAELIEKLLPAVRSLPILLIGTMRPGPFPAWLPRRSLGSSSLSGCRKMKLAP
jgi:hypothetical protein